jgi:hypothetical protein
MTSVPAWLTRPDPDWSGFTWEQVEALTILRHRCTDTDDLMWAGVPVMRSDGAAVISPLTLERIETWTAIYWARQWSEQFSITPDE